MRVIVTVVGKDKSGIIAKVSTELANKNVNIEDISQTIVSGNFTMIMLCDLSNSGLTVDEIASSLKVVGEKIGVSIHVQHEDIFNAINRI